MPASRTPASVGLRAIRERRRHVQGQPGAAPRGGRPHGQGPANDDYVPEVADPLSPRRPSSTRSRSAVDMAASGPTSRLRRLPTLAEQMNRHAAQVVHVHERHARRPLVRRPSTAGTTSAPATWRTGRRSSTGGHPRRCARSSTRRRWTTARRSRVTRSRSSRPTTARSRRSSSSSRSACCRERWRQCAGRRPRPHVRAVLRRIPDPGHDGPLVVPRGGRRAHRRCAHHARCRDVHLGRPRPAADELHGRHRRRLRRAVDRDAGLHLAGEPGRHGRVVRRPLR